MGTENRRPFWVEPEIHQSIKEEAAGRNTNMRLLVEHLIRLGMIAEAEKQTRLAEPKAEYDATDH